MLPFPNDFWRIETENGFRLNFQQDTFPVDDKGKGIDPVRGEWNSLHGSSVFPAITTYFKGMDDKSIENCARWWNIEKSLSLESPTLLLDTVTNLPVPHWVELDHSSKSSETSGKHAFMIWPATSLDFNRRYIVSIKSMTDSRGRKLSPSQTFQELRDGIYSDSSRQAHFNDIFDQLLTQNISRTDLLQSWDFTTTDKTDVQSRLVTARDDARQRLGPSGPQYEITTVEENTSDLVGKRIKGQFLMPTYLNTHLPTKDARLVLDDQSNPVYQGDEWYEFEVIVPTSVMNQTQSAGILQYGHGLFGSYREVEYGSSTYMYEFATEYGYVLCASTWLGLSKQDIPAVGVILLEDLTDFLYVPDRTVQGVVNALGLMMMLKGDFASDPLMLTPSGEKILNTDKTAYMGNSEGGILGAVYMAASQDVQRGMLGVPGGPYGLLLPRSLDFGIEFDLLKLRYSDPVDRINLMQIMQMLWDRAEPSGFMKAVSQDPLINTKPHEILLQYGLGDAQVSWLGAQAVARSSNAVMYVSNAQEHEEQWFGFEMLNDDVVVTGKSAIMGFDFKSPQAPEVNTPPVEEGDTHEMPRRDLRAQEMMGRFFSTGEIFNPCAGTCISDPI